MNKSCSRCTKVVYPLEELKCLDKIWHKTCFKCHECGMVLNMKTYKGFNKLPYCEAHIPKAKATAIADTPELKRIAENTKIQSNVKYHAEFEKLKGKVTQVADDPETLRIKQNTKIISNVAYHGDLEKKAAMEKQRETADIFEGKDNKSEYFSEAFATEELSQYQPTQYQLTNAALDIHQLHETKTLDQHSSASVQPTLQHQTTSQINRKSYSAMIQQEQSNQQVNEQKLQPHNVHEPIRQQKNNLIPSMQANYGSLQLQQGIYQQPNTKAKVYKQMRSSVVQNAHHPSGVRSQDMLSKYYDQSETYAYPSTNAHVSENFYNNNSTNFSISNNMQQNYAYQSNSNSSQVNEAANNSSVSSGVEGVGSIGKIADYDPLTDGPRNIPSTPRQCATLIYSSDTGAVNSSNPRNIGSITDTEPANGVFNSIATNNQKQSYAPQNESRRGHPQNHENIQQPIVYQPKSNVRVYRALYDYEAQDIDEVSFTEGDLIFEIESIDSGWMTGKVERTGKTGMLPANYVHPAMI